MAKQPGIQAMRVLFASFLLTVILTAMSNEAPGGPPAPINAPADVSSTTAQGSHWSEWEQVLSEPSARAPAPLPLSSRAIHADPREANPSPAKEPTLDEAIAATVYEVDEVIDFAPSADFANAVDGTSSYDLPISDVLPSDGTEIYSTNNWFRGGQWYSKQELVMLLRTDLPPVHVAVDQTTDTNGAGVTTDVFVVGSMSTKDADFTYEAGTRLSIGRILGRDVANRDHGIEFTFLGLFDYTGRTTAIPANIESGLGIISLLGSNEADLSRTGQGFGFPFINLVDGFVDAVSQDILYQADLNSFELNYMVGGRPARDRLVMQPDGKWTKFATPSKVRSFFAGLRYIRQNELFHYQSRGNNRLAPIFDTDGTTVIGTFPDPTDESGSYRVTTDNDLFGFQFGGELIQKRTDWVLGLNAKVGGLINFADRNSQLDQRFDNPNDPSDDATFTTRFTTESLDDETLTFLGEANVYVAYYLRPNTSLRFGYNILYLNGVATATNNLGLRGNRFPKFELTGDSLYHGMNFGAEVTW